MDEMTTVFLVRHGESEINRQRPRRLGGMASNSPLTDLGREQARLTSEAMKDFRINAFYSSPLDRAHNTGQIIAAPHGKSVEKIQGIIENDCGNWEGRSYEDIMATEREYYDKWMAHPETVPLPGGENYQQVQDRSLAALDELIKRHPGETILIAAHNTVLKVVLAHALGLHISQSRNVKTSNLGISILESKNGKLSVRTLNSVFHLKKY